MQQLKQEAAQKAKELRVNPRSIKEWKALGDGDLAKIRRLGANAAGESEDVIDTAPKAGPKSSARQRLSADSDESDCASLDEEDSASSEDKEVCAKSSSDLYSKVHVHCLNRSIRSVMICLNYLCLDSHLLPEAEWGESRKNAIWE